MKRKLLICSSLITLLLSVFSVPIFAEETVQDSSNLHTLNDGVFLDSYFFENYDLMPYIQSSSQQYIVTDIKPSSNIGIICRISDFILTGSAQQKYIFGVNYNDQYVYGAYVSRSNNETYLNLMNTVQSISIPFDPYILHEISILGNNGYVDNNLVVSRESNYELNSPIFIFGRSNSGSPAYLSTFKLYSFKVYDYSIDEYIHYYYPAKSKSSGILGLYDAVSKTFISTSGAEAFNNPQLDSSYSFQISTFLSSSLIWIGQIFDAIIQMPIIIVFMAIGLAGAMFRWGRRIVHF